MLRVGQNEVDAVSRVLLSGRVFRYGVGGECQRFESRYAKYLGARHVLMTSSGTTALTAALVGLGVGPGDEVIIPSCTYMASAIAVVGAGAIPVIVDIDDTITIDPAAVADAIGPRTRAVMPVHMWGLPCDMDALMQVAARKKVLVVEDACQAVGGGYQGRRLGSFGNAAGFSFNFYKNMTCGEGGAVVTNDDTVIRRAGCMVDPCSFYWVGRSEGEGSFLASGARASEIEGAILNAQLDRLDPMIRAMRRHKKRVLRETADTGLQPIRANSLEFECGTHVMFTLPTPEQAERFKQCVGGTIAGQTGRHVYTEWDHILSHQGGPHPALNPFKMPANKGCRMDYSKDMCARSLDILDRTVMIGMHPDHKRADVTATIRLIRKAAKAALA